MSDKEQTSQDADKGTETERVQIKSKSEDSKIKIKSENEDNKVKSEEGKTESEDMKVGINKNKEVAINMNEHTDNRDEAVRRKPLTIYFFRRQEIQQQPQGMFPWSTAPPQEPERAPPLNYKMDSRNDFVRLVLLLVLIMLTVTAGFISMALINQPLNEFFHSISIWIIFIPAMVLVMIVNYAFMCSPCANTLPCNIVMLFLATVGMTLMATKISVMYGTEVVLYAVLATAGIVLVCVGLACTNFDFTRFLLYVVVISAAFTVIAMIILLVKVVTGVWMKPVIIAILAISTLIQSVLLVIEIQTVIGGGSVELSEDDYALGAYMIYTSIIEIFLRMVQIIGISGRD